MVRRVSGGEWEWLKRGEKERDGEDGEDGDIDIVVEEVE